MKNTKILVVTHYEHIGTMTGGADLTKKIEAALEPYPSSEWTLRSASTAINTIRDSESEGVPDTTYVTTIVLDRINR